MKQCRILVLLLVAFVFPSSPADADEKDCLDREPERVSRFGYMQALDQIKLCMGAGNDRESKLAQAFSKLSKDETNVTTRAKNISLIAGQLQGTAEAWASRATDPAERAIWITVRESIVSESALLAQPYETFSADELRRWKALVFNPARWQLAVDKVGMLSDVNLLVFDITHCATNPPTFNQCENYSSRKDLLRVVNVGHQLGQYIVHDEFVANLRRAELRDTQWTQYHEEALFQWPWEHVINGYRMKSSKQKLCDRREDGMQVGFCRVPSDQLIVLHPDVALQWVSGAENSSELHAAAYLELFGRYSWTWDSEGKISKPRGWSVIALYSNLTGESEIGYGVMYHGKRAQTIALTVTDGKIGVLASLAVTDRFFTASSAARTRMKTLLEGLQGP